MKINPENLDGSIPDRFKKIVYIQNPLTLRIDITLDNGTIYRYNINLN